MFVSRLYLLDLPFAKFWVSFGCELTIAIWFTALRTDSVSVAPLRLDGSIFTAPWRPIMLLWTASGILWELRQVVVAGFGEDVDDKASIILNWSKHCWGGIQEYCA